MLIETMPWMQATRGSLLVLADESRAASFRAQAPAARVLTDEASLNGVHGPFAAAIIDGFLEREPWDRWVLQRVHRLLALGAPLVLTLPRLLSPAALTDLAFLGYAAAKVRRRVLARRDGFEAPPVRVHRRYHVPRVVRRLQALGFTGIQASRTLGARATLKARKAPSLTPAGKEPWPDAELHGRWYAEQYAAIEAASDAWLARHPRLRAAAPGALEPSAWRDARVLVLAPHPDDELVGCGGTLTRLASAGARLDIVQATDGAGLESLRRLPEAARRSARLAEAQSVASALGARLHLWRKADAGLECTSGTVAELAQLLGELCPTHVFTPFHGDLHADHRALSRILAEALGIVPLPVQVLQYEVWGRVPANLYCDVTGQAEALESLLWLYPHAMQVDDFVHFCERRNGTRGRELTGRPARVEAFLCSSGVDFRRLA